MLSALAQHSTFCRPAPASPYCVPVLRECENGEGWDGGEMGGEGCQRGGECGTRRPPARFEIDAKKGIDPSRNTCRSRFGHRISCPGESELRTDAPPRWLAGNPAAASVRWPSVSVVYFEQARVPPVLSASEGPLVAGPGRGPEWTPRRSRSRSSTRGRVWRGPRGTLRMICEVVISGSGASSATCWLPCAGEWTALWVLASCCLMLS